MSSNYATPLGISSAILASAIVLQSGALFYVFRKFRRFQQELSDILSDYSALRSELTLLKNRVHTLEGRKNETQQLNVRFTPILNATITEQLPQSPQLPQSFNQPLSRVSSMASSSTEYADACDEWPISDDKTALIPTTADSNNRKILTTADFKEIDDLHEKGEYKHCYDILKKSYDGNHDNVEILWRLARACHNMASSFDQKNPNRKALITEGHKYALHAYNLDEKNFYVLKFAAVLSGASTDYLGTKEKIQEGNKFKMYLDKGLAINPTEYSLLHMRGRFSFSVANLSWFERKAASAFFAAPPTATIDDALTDFLEVEKIKPSQWIENLMYVGRCYIAKHNKPDAAKYFKIALSVEPIDDADKECLEEIKELLNSVSK